MDTYLGFLKDNYLSQEFPDYFKDRSLYDRPKKFINITIALKQRQPGKKRKDEALNKLHKQFEDNEKTGKVINISNIGNIDGGNAKYIFIEGAPCRSWKYDTCLAFLPIVGHG